MLFAQESISSQSRRSWNSSGMLRLIARVENPPSGQATAEDDVATDTESLGLGHDVARLVHSGSGSSSGARPGWS